MHEYENFRRVAYGHHEDQDGQAVFIPVCIRCARFVKPDETVQFGEGGLAPGPNATCTQHGRTEMLFEGFL
ncbi:hypothetical protein LCGC14_0609880 [marine sediment metagenome]|uniref:Uncharacterized protein n=1 Tax=marine sediment metagenome TaxID=412755 RepID=A0A0F9RS72_9ZZZZ